MVRLAIATIFLMAAVAVVVTNAEASAVTKSKYAYATIHYEGTPKDAEYLLAIRVMMRSLRRTGTKADVVVLVSPNVKAETRQVLRQDGAIVTEVPNLANPYKAAQAQGEPQRYLARFEFTLNKLYMWNLTQYERVVYLDADNIALGNLDELFDCGHFCAVFMNPCNFHTGLLVIKPDTKQFNHMVESLPSIESYDGADQGFLTAFFPFKEMGGAPMFDPENPQKDAPLLRLPPGYNLNALWYYEHGNWRLYGCHPRFKQMGTTPGLAMTFPVAPFIKPWNWWPYLILDDNWNSWQGIRAELGESHSHVLIFAMLLLAGFTGLVLWLSANLLQSPCLASPTSRSKVLRGLDTLIGYSSKSVVGLALGIVCVFLSGIIPFMMLPATLPPTLAYFIFVVSEFTLNFDFVVFAASYLRSDATKARLMPTLLRKTLIAFLPAVVVASITGAIVTWKLYPKWMFHLGKIIFVAQTAFVMLLLQVNIYKRLLVQARPNPPARVKPEETRLPM